MNLKQYFFGKKHGAKKEMAEALGVSQTWIGLLIVKVKKPSPILAKKIEKFTNGLVTSKELRPDIFN